MTSSNLPICTCLVISILAWLTLNSPLIFPVSVIIIENCNNYIAEFINKFNITPKKVVFMLYTQMKCEFVS